MIPSFIIEFQSNEMALIIQEFLFSRGYQWLNFKNSAKSFSDKGLPNRIGNIEYDGKSDEMKSYKILFYSYPNLNNYKTARFFKAESELKEFVRYIDKSISNIKLQLNNDYKAIISDKVTVGCQTFDLDKIIELGKLAEKRNIELNS